jgi:alanyl-tRNA synthetase
MKRKELIKKYVEFFISKGHEEILNSSLVPENDPSVLFTTAGMHPLVPYLLGQKHPLGNRLCNVQKCIRTGDIEEVGDSYHHTFFEMLGNWSLGDYWKEDAIKFTFEFYTKVLKISKEKLAITCFKGDKDAEKDFSSSQIWISLGIPKERVAFLGKDDNWWGPVGNTGPCGPDTEIFYWNGKSKSSKKFNPKDKNWVEIGNDVFMQYNKNEKGNYNEAKQRNVDFGGGVERGLAILNNVEDDYKTEIFLPIIKEIEKLSKKKYEGGKEITRAMRIIADHIKASVFIISEGIIPSNTEQGYVLRRLIRRSVKYARELNLKESISKIAIPVFSVYDDYSELQKNKTKILNEIEKEEEKFKQTLERGINQFKKFSNNKKISGEESFLLYQSYGFPIEMIEEECKTHNIKFSEQDFEKELKKHQELSRTAAAGRFKSGLADNSEATTKLHTTAHLLLASLRQVLKDKNINQRGSNITPERLRLDFSFSRKLTDEEIKKIENLVNEKIKQSILVIREEMSLDNARKAGALGIFESKYEEKVFVYSINDFSREICAGPHVNNTKELGHFKIQKEESSSSGVRRIKAVLE